MLPRKPPVRPRSYHHGGTVGGGRPDAGNRRAFAENFSGTQPTAPGGLPARPAAVAIHLRGLVSPFLPVWRARHFDGMFPDQCAPFVIRAAIHSVRGAVLLAWILTPPPSAVFPSMPVRPLAGTWLLARLASAFRVFVRGAQFPFAIAQASLSVRALPAPSRRGFDGLCAVLPIPSRSRGWRKACPRCHRMDRPAKGSVCRGLRESD